MLAHPLPPGGTLTTLKIFLWKIPVRQIIHPANECASGFFIEWVVLPLAKLLQLCGRRWIRTTEDVRQQIYSLPHLATLVFSLILRTFFVHTGRKSLCSCCPLWIGSLSLAHPVPRLPATFGLARIARPSRFGVAFRKARFPPPKNDNCFAIIRGFVQSALSSKLDRRFPKSPTGFAGIFLYRDSYFRADGGIRTPDQLITNQLLWPTELHRQFALFQGCKITNKFLIRKIFSLKIFPTGGRNCNSMPDPHIFFENAGAKIRFFL